MLCSSNLICSPFIDDRYQSRVFPQLKVLAQKTYDAQLAGLHWSVSRHSCGYVVHVSGFSQKIDLLLEQVKGRRVARGGVSGGGVNSSVSCITAVVI